MAWRRPGDKPLSEPMTRPQWLKRNLGIYILGIQVNIILELMSGDLVAGMLTLVQVMAWCRQAPSHYLNQC